VIFYFRREDQLRVLNRLYDTLRPGGALLIGATELPLVPIRAGVTPTRIGDALAYRRPWNRWQ
jgi:chemotaxis methyl-accepting protein methylase